MSEQRGKVRLAVVDTDTSFLTVLGKRLESAGWEYRTLAAGVPTEELVAMKVDALLIDPEVLGPRSWEFLELVAGALPDLGVIVCSGRSTVAQRVRGLRLGADDWVNKPCHPEEVMARIEAVVRRRRRVSAERDAGPKVVGEVEIRSDRFQAYVAGQSVGLTRREYELLALLANDPGRVIEREDIYQQVWGYAMAHGDRSVDVFIKKVRGKLRRHSPGWTYIHTHFGIGYRFDPESADASATSIPDEAGSTPEDRSGISGNPAPKRV